MGLNSTSEWLAGASIVQTWRCCELSHSCRLLTWIWSGKVIHHKRHLLMQQVFTNASHLRCLPFHVTVNSTLSQLVSITSHLSAHAFPWLWEGSSSRVGRASNQNLFSDAENDCNARNRTARQFINNLSRVQPL